MSSAAARVPAQADVAAAEPGPPGPVVQAEQEPPRQRGQAGIGPDRPVQGAHQAAQVRMAGQPGERARGDVARPVVGG